MFKNLSELVDRAKALGPGRIAVVEAHDPDVLESLGQAEPMGLAKGILVGNPAKIEAAAKKVGYTIRPDAIVPTTGESDSVRQAIDLVRDGKADLLMKGKVTTATLIRGIVDKERGLRTGSQLSQVIVFQVPHLQRLMLMTDAAINIAPTLAQKADITRNAITVAHAIGIAEPNVVLLTALEFVNPDMPATVDAAALVGMHRRARSPARTSRSDCDGRAAQQVRGGAEEHPESRSSRTPTSSSHRTSRPRTSCSAPCCTSPRANPAASSLAPKCRSCCCRARSRRRRKFTQWRLPFWCGSIRQRHRVLRSRVLGS